MADFFVELFPIELDSIPALAAYTVHFTDNATQSGHKLAYHLQQHTDVKWVWTQYRLVTDTPLPEEQIAAALDSIHQNAAKLAKTVEAIVYDSEWQPTAQSAADFMLQTDIKVMYPKLRDSIKSMNTRIPNAFILREADLQAWVVDGLPAISLSVRSQLVYEHDLQLYVTQTNIEDTIGLNVMDKTATSKIATIKSHKGELVDYREEILAATNSIELQNIVHNEADDAAVFEIENDEGNYDYVASALHILIDSQDFTRFDINTELARKSLDLAPDARAQLVRTASDLLKQKGLIGNAYNSRSHSELFASLEIMPSIEFSKGKIRPYSPENLSNAFVQNGLYARHPRFQNAPIRVAVINTLQDTIVADFVEAMRRQIEKDFDFSIELIKERNVRVISDSNLASAVREVEKETPQIVLAFFPDVGSTVASAETLKSLTLGKGIASHIVYETTMHEVDAMGLVIMGILAKTGNVPFALAEPIDFAHMIVGLDWVHEKMTRSERIVGLSRIYRRDGMFMRYFMDMEDLELGEEPPLRLVQTLLPEIIFKGKEVVIHHQGTFSNTLLQQLDHWGAQLGARFYPVEILLDDVPNLYALEGKVTQAGWGSLFLLGDRDSFAMTTMLAPETSSNPLHIRTPLANLPIAQAVYSVLGWTLLHYGTLGAPKLPVTVQNADKLAEWLARGILPEKDKGDVPFWL